MDTSTQEFIDKCEEESNHQDLSADGCRSLNEALHLAAYQGKIKAIEVTLKLGADVNSTLALEEAGWDVRIKLESERDQTPLTLAAFGGHANCLRLLLAHGANINFKDKEDVSALMYAAKNGHTECVKILASINPSSIDVYNFYEEHGFEEPFQLGGFTAGILAAKYGHTDCVLELLKLGANINRGHMEKLKTMIWYAAGKGNHKLLKELIKRGAYVNMYDRDVRTPLMVAAYNGHYQCVEELCLHNAYLNVSGPSASYSKTAFHGAIKCKHVNCAKILHSAGCDTNLKRGRNVTPVSKLEAYQDFERYLEEITNNDIAANLSHCCRELIRKQLSLVNPGYNLVYLINKLKLPKSQKLYLVYDTCTTIF